MPVRYEDAAIQAGPSSWVQACRMRKQQAIFIALRRIAEERDILSCICNTWRHYARVARDRTKVLELRRELTEANGRHEELKSRHEEQGQSLRTTEEALQHWERRISLQSQWLFSLEEQLQAYEQSRPPPRPSQAPPVDVACQTDLAESDETQGANGEMLASLSFSSGGFSVCSSPCEYAREEAEDAQVQRQRVTALSQRLLERERRVVALKEALAQKMSSPSMYRGCMGKENVAWDPSSRIS